MENDLGTGQGWGWGKSCCLFEDNELRMPSDCEGLVMLLSKLDVKLPPFSRNPTQTKMNKQHIKKKLRDEQETHI